jgi:hypothetical protein
MNRHLVMACMSCTLIAVTAGAYGQGGASMTIDIGALAPNLAPQFTLARTGQGTAAEWSVVADPTAVNGRALS